MHALVRKWLTYLERDRGASAHTIRAYSSDLRHLHDYLGARGADLSAVDRRQLRGWLASLGSPGKRPAPASLARRVATLRSFYGWAHAEGQLAVNPAAMLRGPRVPKTVPRILEVPEADAVMQRPSQHGILELRNRALL